MKKSNLIAVIAALIATGSAQADQNALNTKALDFVSALFNRASIAAKTLNKETLLNGTPAQEGFCKLIHDSVPMDLMIPYVAGQPLWASATEKQKQEFTVAAYSNLSVFIGLGFQNYTQSGAPEFTIDTRKTTEKSIHVNVKIPNDNAAMFIAIRTMENGDVKMIDSTINGISTFKSKQMEFASAAKGSMDTLLGKLKQVNKRYGECRLNF
jgi:ABC-type transporter MlaC component